MALTAARITNSTNFQHRVLTAFLPLLGPPELTSSVKLVPLAQARPRLLLWLLPPGAPRVRHHPPLPVPVPGHAPRHAPLHTGGGGGGGGPPRSLILLAGSPSPGRSGSSRLAAITRMGLSLSLSVLGRSLALPLLSGLLGVVEVVGVVVVQSLLLAVYTAHVVMMTESKLPAVAPRTCTSPAVTAQSECYLPPSVCPPHLLLSALHISSTLYQLSAIQRSTDRPRKA